MLKRVTLLASLAVVFAAVAAAPAFAAGAAWSNTGGLIMKGTLTLKRDGGSAVTCPVSPTTLFAENYEKEAIFYTNFFPIPTAKCSNGENWQFTAAGDVHPSGSGFLFEQFGGGTGLVSPWKENYAGTGGLVPFVNGSGSTMSHIDFSETYMGITTGGKKVTASGSLEIYRSGVLLVTVKAL